MRHDACPRASGASMTAGAPAGILVRAARSDDYPEVVRLAGLMYQATGLANERAGWQEEAVTALDQRLGRDVAVFVAEPASASGEGLIGVVAGSLNARLPGPPLPGGLAGYVQWVWTEPGWRGKGVARALMTALLDWFRPKGAAVVELHASPDGEALYRSMGFSEGTLPALRLRF